MGVELDEGKGSGGAATHWLCKGRTLSGMDSELPRNELSTEGPGLRLLVSGGQTGVDRAALDAAMALGVPVGGWCPRGRRAEDGVVPARYPLRETPSRRYAQRTRWNVRDSDATLILLHGEEAEGGTALTVRAAHAEGRPTRVVDLGAEREGTRAEKEGVEAVRAWLRSEHVWVLNVAGPRASEALGVYAAARVFVHALLAGLRG